jgi:hypothetical protein
MKQIEIHYDKIDMASIDMHIDTSDYPDFVDSYILKADYDGRPMTDAELDVLNDDSDFVYEQILKRIY